MLCAFIPVSVTWAMWQHFTLFSSSLCSVWPHCPLNNTRQISNSRFLHQIGCCWRMTWGKKHPSFCNRASECSYSEITDIICFSVFQGERLFVSSFNVDLFLSIWIRVWSRQEFFFFCFFLFWSFLLWKPYQTSLSNWAVNTRLHYLFQMRFKAVIRTPVWL